MRRRIWAVEQPSSFIVKPPPVRLAGYYYVDLIDIDSGEVKQHLEFPNLITDSGLDMIGNDVRLDDIYATMSVGTDGTTPTTSDTSLGAAIASTTSNGGIADVDAFVTGSEEYVSRKRTRIFLGPEANGDLEELGFVYGGVTANRSLFKDIFGNPTVVPKTSKDLLHVVYEYRVYAPITDITSSFQIGPPSSASTTYTMRPQNVGATDGWNVMLDEMGNWTASHGRMHELQTIGSRTGNTNPTPSDDVDNLYITVSPYTNGTLYRDIQYELRLQDANFTSDIGLITWRPWSGSNQRMLWQTYFWTPAEKDENLVMKITFRQSWDRV